MPIVGRISLVLPFHQICHVTKSHSQILDESSPQTIWTRLSLVLRSAPWVPGNFPLLSRLWQPRGRLCAQSILGQLRLLASGTCSGKHLGHGQGNHSVHAVESRAACSRMRRPAKICLISMYSSMNGDTSVRQRSSCNTHVSSKTSSATCASELATAGLRTGLHRLADRPQARWHLPTACRKRRFKPCRKPALKRFCH